MLKKGEIACYEQFLLSHTVFKRPALQTLINIRANLGMGLFLSQTSPGFYMSAVASLLKTLLEKVELLVTSNSSFSHSVFYLFEKHSAIFIKFEIVVCKLYQFGPVWKSRKFVVWGRVIRAFFSICCTVICCKTWRLVYGWLYLGLLLFNPLPDDKF